MSNVQKREDTAPAAADAYQAQPERWLSPRALIYANNDEVVLELEMPGVQRDKIEVTVERDELTVTGWRQAENYENVQVLHQERAPFHYKRAFVLSESVRADKISANYDNGVLRLTIPKAEDSKPRRIAIQ
ncbi:MAG: Hsp20/alpha crystallin family protein [Candidatus Sumerlaeaceae bacterium]|nr:Hsp20/alpha crystallin family protein [Candidatus Sumerlaeaceae bacterium]